MLRTLAVAQGPDLFYAANEVGLDGEVIGIDMTDEQLKKSAFLSNMANFNQVILHKSYIEKLPIISESMGVVIRNGVINLSSEKVQVFQEAACILRPGDRFLIADIVSSVQLLKI